MKHTNIARLLLVITSFLWGVGFVATDIIIEVVPPFAFLAIRFIIAAFILYILKMKTIHKQFGEHND